jgi:hypothetical protein
MPAHTKTPDDLKALFGKFINLSSADAARAVRFMTRNSGKSSA